MMHTRVADGGPLIVSLTVFFTVNGSMRFVNLNFTGNKSLDGTGIYGGAILLSTES